MTEEEKESTARPTPPCQGSNPAWTLVRYHERWAMPRATVSSTKSITSKLSVRSADGATKEMTSLEPLLPVHTSQLRPPTVAVPTREPMGWIGPTRFSQIMISVRLTPSLLGVGSSQMS